MINKFTLLSFFILIISSSFGQSTKIYGTAENASGYEIKLKTYTDFFSMTEQLLSESVVQKDGSFELKTDLKATKLCFLVIGFQRAEIYLEPGRTYHLSINYDKRNEQITFVNKAYLNFNFVDLPREDLNNQIGDFNSKSNEFLVANFDRIYKRRDKKIIREFSNSIYQDFKNPSAFLKNYIDFRLASIEYSSGLKNRLEIQHDYFQNGIIFYENDEYVHAFNELFDKYLMNPNPYFEVQQLRNEIFGDANLERIFSALDNDPLLKDQEFKELVLLRSLYELYFVPASNKDAIVSLIDDLGQKTLFPSIDKIALNFIHQLTYLQPGAEFPKHEILDISLIQNEAMRAEKLIFFNFFTFPCAECMREMDSIASLHEKYSKQVLFISIALNVNESEIEQLIKAKKYAWKIIRATQPFILAETYKIKSLPSYFLIDSKRKILLNPALVPWKGFSPSFKSILKY